MVPPEHGQREYDQPHRHQRDKFRDGVTCVCGRSPDHAIHDSGPVLPGFDTWEEVDR